MMRWAITLISLCLICVFELSILFQAVYRGFR
jgi:hypothetical protein